MKSVRFVTKHAPYNAGEVAGFSDDVADVYIKAGIAEAASNESPQTESESDPASRQSPIKDTTLERGKTGSESTQKSKSLGDESGAKGNSETIGGGKK